MNARHIEPATPDADTPTGTGIGTAAFHRATASSELAEGAGLPMTLAGWNLLLCRLDGRIHAIENRCSHREEVLAGGRLRRGQIFCPHHGARFDLKTGASCSQQMTRNPIRVFETRLDDDGVVAVLLPVDPPARSPFAR